MRRCAYTPISWMESFSIDDRIPDFEFRDIIKETGTCTGRQGYEQGWQGQDLRQVAVIFVFKKKWIWGQKGLSPMSGLICLQ